MVLIVWQGIISLHQKTFLEALTRHPQVSKVIMVVEQDITPYRKNMGWTVPKINGVDLIVAPSVHKIESLFADYIDAVHLLGGIRVGKMMTKALEVGAKRGAKMGVLSEPYGKSGWKGKLRHLKYVYLSMFYFKHIQYILAVGKEGVRQYKQLGFKKDNVYPWAYFINVDKQSATVVHNTNSVRIIFAGRLEQGKGILRFVQELSKFDSEKYHLDIFGDGPDKTELVAFVNQHKLSDAISINPFLPYEDMVKKYANYDWVLLPSTAKDGWGVIISEGLLNGLKAMVSSICGVSWVIKSQFNGEVFNWDETEDCRNKIGTMLENDGYAKAEEIQQWAQKTISADVGASYFIDIINCTYSHSVKPETPWLKNNL